MSSWSERADAVLAPTYRRPSHLFVAGEGPWLIDEDGTPFLDLTSGIAVNALGHRAGPIRDALIAGADGLIHTSNLFHTGPAIALAERLVARSFADKVFFANSGAEANEGAIKFARLASGPERREIVAFSGSFHGRTLGALAATDRPAYQAPFRPLPEGFTHAAWDDEAGLSAITERTAAVMVEPIQGEAGVRVPRDAWLRAVRARCDETGALLVADEVQAGLGRTGRLWAHAWSGITPDLMTLAKPLAGGLPMGAVLMNARVAASVTPGCHATTFGGGPLVASVAIAVFDAITAPGFLDAVHAKGERLRDALLALDGVRGVRGRGLLAGIEVAPDTAARVMAVARDERLLVVSAGPDVVRLLPPLNIDDDVLDEGVARLGRALVRVTRGGSA